MRLFTRQLPDNHNIFHFGDVHEGSSLSSRSGWKQLLSMMDTQYEGCSNNYGIEGGDMVEGILIDDKRFSPEMLHQPLALEQLEIAIEMRRPIKDKLITILQGNHERKLHKFGDFTAKVCTELGVDYGTYAAKITVKDAKGKLMYKVFEIHGAKTISSTADDPKRRKTNMNLILKRQLKAKSGDCAVMVKHHAHKLLVCKPESDLYLVDDGKRVRQAYTSWGQTESFIHPDARWYGCAGSFLKLYGDGFSGYAEVGEYDPVELGFLVLKVRDKKIVGLDPIYLDI